jgi:D-serine deaminase-like pyridoxal phosphate-dependent protein
LLCFAERLRQTEVNHADVEMSVQEDILGFEVAMNNALLAMQIIEHTDQLEIDSTHDIFAKTFVIVDKVKEIAILDDFDHTIEILIIVNSIEERDRKSVV